MAQHGNALCVARSNSSFFFVLHDLCLDEDFCRLVSTVAKRKFAVSTVLQFLRVASDGVTTPFRVGGRVVPGMPLLVALRPELVALIDSLDIREIVYNPPYDLATDLMAWGTMKSVNRVSVSIVPVAQLPDNFARS